MNEYDNGEILPISATVQAYWEVENEMIDSDNEEARTENWQLRQEPKRRQQSRKNKRLRRDTHELLH